MDQQSALTYARDMMDTKGTSADDANVQVVRMRGVVIIKGRIPREVRNAYMRAVKSGQLGRLKKEGLKPEAFFHPNSIWNAKDQRAAIENASLRAIAGVYATNPVAIALSFAGPQEEDRIIEIVDEEEES